MNTTNQAVTDLLTAIRSADTEAGLAVLTLQIPDVAEYDSRDASRTGDYWTLVYASATRRNQLLGRTVLV
jgi:hypothetical protein